MARFLIAASHRSILGHLSVSPTNISKKGNTLHQPINLSHPSRAGRFLQRILRKYSLPPTPILLLVQSLGHGGCERDAAKLAIGLDRNQFTPHVGTLREGGFRLAAVRDAGIPIINFPVTSFMKASVVSAAKQFRDYCVAHGIQIVHAFDVPTDIFGSLAARYSKLPAIVTAQLSFRTLVAWRERMLLRVADRCSNVIVVNSQAVGDSLIRNYAVPSEKIYLCYNGVNSEEFHPGQAKQPEFLANASVVVGSVCVMRPEKRVDWLIRSFSSLRDINSQGRLLLVGSGPEVPRLKELASELGISDVTFFVPGQPDVADWMRMMDIYVNASVSESFPNALLEAMACGCCAVGSRVGGIPELIDHGKSGLTFDTQSPESLTEALRLVLSNAELRQALREKGSITAKSKFSMSNTIERMQALYSSLGHNHLPAI